MPAPLIDVDKIHSDGMVTNSDFTGAGQVTVLILYPKPGDITRCGQYDDLATHSDLLSSVHTTP